MEDGRAPQVPRHDGRGRRALRRASREGARERRPLAPPKVPHQNTALGATDVERRARCLRRGDQKCELIRGRIKEDGRILDVDSVAVEVAEGEGQTVVLRAFLFIGITIRVRIISDMIVTHVPIIR